MFFHFIDVGLAEKYKDSNGIHRACEKTDKFTEVTAFASRSATNQRTQSRRDDIESLYYLIAFLFGIPLPRGNDTKELYSDKDQFCKDSEHIVRLLS